MDTKEIAKWHRQPLQSPNHSSIFEWDWCKTYHDSSFKDPNSNIGNPIINSNITQKQEDEDQYNVHTPYRCGHVIRKCMRYNSLGVLILENLQTEDDSESIISPARNRSTNSLWRRYYTSSVEGETNILRGLLWWERWTSKLQIANCSIGLSAIRWGVAVRLFHSRVRTNVQYESTCLTFAFASKIGRWHKRVDNCRTIFGWILLFYISDNFGLGTQNLRWKSNDTNKLQRPVCAKQSVSKPACLILSSFPREFVRLTKIYCFFLYYHFCL